MINYTSTCYSWLPRWRSDATPAWPGVSSSFSWLVPCDTPAAVQHRIIGTTMPVLEMSLQPNEVIFAESGELSWISASINLRTSTSAGGQSGGFLGVLGRAVAGGTIFMTEYLAQGGRG